MNTAYFTKRAGMMVLNLLFATFLTFVLLQLTPGDPADLIIRKVFVGTEDYVSSSQELDHVSQTYGLREPVIEQYWRWLRDAMCLDFGYSYATRLKVSEELAERFRVSAVLALASLALSAIVTIIFGVLYNLRSRFLRTIIDSAILLFISLPNFYLALMMIIVFSLYFDVLPVSGNGGLEYYILPTVVLCLTMFGFSARIMNSSVRQTLAKEYIVTANAKGLRPISIFRRHVLRNAMLPVVPYMALQLGYNISGVVVIETVFSLPGIGKYLMDSLQTKDIPAIQASVLLIAMIFSLSNLLADAAVLAMDPRVRYQAE